MALETRVRQRMEYELKFGPIGKLMDSMIVRKKWDGRHQEGFFFFRRIEALQSRPEQASSGKGAAVAMAYDEGASRNRIRRALGPRTGRDRKEDVRWHGVPARREDVFAGIVKDDLMVRVGPEQYEAALAEAHVRPMDSFQPGAR